MTWTLRELSAKYWDGESLLLEAWYRGDDRSNACVQVECSGRLVELWDELDREIKDRVDEHMRSVFPTEK
jgi:hypothetical protein